MGMSGPPPLPPGMGGAAAPAGPNPPSMQQLAGMGPGQAPPPQTSGQGQVSDAVVRMASEIDQALKLLAQALPAISPWVEQVVIGLRTQIGTALQGGAVPTNPTPEDNSRFPDGGSRL
jgi:hypothetical protein